MSELAATLNDQAALAAETRDTPVAPRNLADRIADGDGDPRTYLGDLTTTAALEGRWEAPGDSSVPTVYVPTSK